MNCTVRPYSSAGTHFLNRHLILSISLSPPLLLPSFWSLMSSSLVSAKSHNSIIHSFLLCWFHSMSCPSYVPSFCASCSDIRSRRHSCLCLQLVWGRDACCFGARVDSFSFPFCCPCPIPWGMRLCMTAVAAVANISPFSWEWVMRECGGSCVARLCTRHNLSFGDTKKFSGNVLGR